jgi:histidinol-phosphate aminotransferase
MIRINKNESPVPSLSEEKIREIIQETPFFRYPAEEHDRFVEAYAKFHHLDPQCIAIANGSDEWIQKFMILLGDGPMMTLDPDFSMYEGYARQLKRPVVKVPCNDDFTFDEERTVQAIREHKPSFFIFSQPNNPTGAMHSDSFVQSVADAVTESGGYLVVDEAYLEFSKRTYEKPSGDNVITIRTLSKIYGLAGLRIGVAVSTRNTIEMLNSIAHPYPVNSLSLNIGTYLLTHEEDLRTFFSRQRALSDKLKEIFSETVSDVVEVLPSETNFVFTYGKNAPSLGEYIMDKGFLPRLYKDERLKDVVRYSIAEEKDLERLHEVLKEWRAKL